ncbi:MAG: hypothetical protein MUF44_11480 [Hydrogenophaga sp.]|nr:hypothetical protein [Hydrogenophaga sp.]
MAEVSDFDVATAQRFLTGAAPLTTTFFSGGRNANKVAILQVSALGGARSGVCRPSGARAAGWRGSTSA